MIKHSLLAGVGALALGFASPAMAAGNLVLTGHDDDFHCANGNFSTSPGISPCAQLGAMTSFARNGSTLPVLVIDNGTELANSLSGLSVPIVTKSVASVTAADFNHSIYSAFAVASVTSCGGCDNPTGTGTTLAAFASSIASFFNSGGGIVGLTAAGDPAGFAYVPQATAGTPIFHDSGFVVTADGSTIPGFDSVNGDETHNIFTTTTGYSIAEVDSTDANAPVTIFVRNGIITGTTITGGGTPVPEPISLSLLGAGLFGLGAARRFRRQAA